MSAMAKHVPVVYLDQGRGPVGRVVWSEPEPNVRLVRGLVKMVYALRMRRMGCLVPAYVNWQLRHIRRFYQRVILWTAENWLQPFRFLPHDTYIFDCIDPCFGTVPEEVKQFEKREEQCIRAADEVFASADVLVEFCRQFSSRVTLLNNAAELSDYTPDLVAAAIKPGWWPQGEAPLGAYLGTIDARFDVRAAEMAAEKNENMRFVFAGSISPEMRTQIATLEKLPNVVLPGRISVEEGRYLLGNCRMGLIPFCSTPINDAVNPVKMYAYAGLGKPIVGTATRELVKCREYASIANGPAEFAQAVTWVCENAPSPTEVRRLKAFAAANTWEARAAQVWARIS